jgi:LAS superfamily LD-carboxypeptidase LdcB
MHIMNAQTQKSLLTLGGVILIGLIILGFVKYKNLRADNIKLTSTLSVKEEDLLKTNHEKQELTEALTNANATIETFQGQLNGLSSTVGTLVKLKETDPELLKKYSKVYFLNENYVPKGLGDIDPIYRFEKTKPLQFLEKPEPYLYRLLDDARLAGLDLSIVSAYRSFAAQSGLKSTYKISYGSGANAFSADQGYSEHQLGTAVDFTTTKVGGNFVGFDKTPEYAWLLENAYKYGFVLSYPKGNSYYVFEPWHWRFVGVALATRLHEDRQNFMDLEQRQLDAYLVNIFN